MKRLTFQIGITLLLLFSILWVRPVPVHGCTTTPEGTKAPTIAETAASVDIILLGTVTSLKEDAVTLFETAVVDVEHYLKGSGPEQVELEGFGPGSVCRFFVPEGARLIFFIHLSQDGTFNLNWQQAGGTVSTPTDSVLAEIADVTGNEVVNIAVTVTSSAVSADEAVEPIVEEEVTETAVSPQNNLNQTVLLFSGIGFVIVLLALTAVWWRQQNRSKAS